MKLLEGMFLKLSTHLHRTGLGYGLFPFQPFIGMLMQGVNPRLQVAQRRDDHRNVQTVGLVQEVEDRTVPKGEDMDDIVVSKS